METSVGTYGSVRFSVDVRYWECPLMESPLCYVVKYSCVNIKLGQDSRPVLKIRNIIVLVGHFNECSLIC